MLKSFRGDGDAASKNAIQRRSAQRIQLESCSNHFLNGSPWENGFRDALKKDPSIKVPDKLVRALRGKLSGAIYHNVGNPSGIFQSALAVLPHQVAGSDHSTCGDWCKYRQLKAAGDDDRAVAYTPSPAMIELKGGIKGDPNAADAYKSHSHGVANAGTRAGAAAVVAAASARHKSAAAAAGDATAPKRRRKCANCGLGYHNYKMCRAPPKADPTIDIEQITTQFL
eukprot:SAG11_NODE_4929_length_1719_cov_1.545679_2_plen_226_part_00